MRVGLLILLIATASCSQRFNNTTAGALTAGTLGAGLGAIVGSASGHAGPGIAIGAAAGLLGGALLGNSIDNQEQENSRLQDELSRQQQVIDENQRLLDELRRQGADVQLTDRGVVVNLPDVLFAFGSSQLTPQTRGTIGEISRTIGKVQHRSITVEGHTDSVGSPEANLRLSRARANRVADALLANGVPAQQLSTYGYGEGAPRASNNSSIGRARNRRVEIIVEN